MQPNSPPAPSAPAQLQALRAMVDFHWPLPSLDFLAALREFHRQAGDVFQISVPGFQMVVMAGPEAARFLYQTNRHQFRWRLRGDAIERLLQSGLLVNDGEEHDTLREVMEPALHPHALPGYFPAIIRRTDQILDTWEDGQTYDMLDEMRRIALLVLTDTLFGVDISADLARLWRPVLRSLGYISPGPWMLWPDMPRPTFTRPLRELDDFLYQIITERRANPGQNDDLLSRLIAADLSDAMIRDQLLTMVIAGHDTSTALLAWTLYLLGANPQTLAQAQVEIDRVVGDSAPTVESGKQLDYVTRALKESMRLYPPSHASMRQTAEPIEFGGYHIPAGTRVLFSIYLTHRHPAHWPDPDRFDPDRFAGSRPKSFTYVPFGGGPRNCVGRSFGNFEALFILARLLQRFDLTLTQPHIHLHMGATIEPRPGVLMRVQRR